MPDRDYYDVLGIARDATADQIKKAYRTLARKYHPDVNPGDKTAEAKFKQAQEAYDVLSDPEKKSLYDRYGSAAFEGAGPFGPRGRASEWAAQQAGAGPHTQTFDFSEFFGPGYEAETEAAGGGIFDELLGRFRTSRGTRRSAPRGSGEATARLTIPFLTAVRGGETTIEVEREGGQRETLVVKIPPGIEPGAKLRLKGQGATIEPGGARGPLTIQVGVEPHPYFTRQGRDLSVEVPVTVAEAVLGARIEVPTLDGLKALTIPAGSSSGQKLRLRGQGVPAARSHADGDLFVILKVVVPRHVDEASADLIRQFAERNPQRPREGLWTS